MKIGIIFPVINCLELTKAAINSIKTVHEVDVLVIDNGSNDGTVQWCRDNNIKIIVNGDNLGLTKAWNQGFNWAIENKCDYIGLFNNDIVLNPNTIDNMVAELIKHEDWGMVSAVNERGWCDANGGIESIKTKEIPAEPTNAEHPDFSCFMIRPNTFERLKKYEIGYNHAEPNPGMFDEEFSIRGKAYFEDNDFHYRMRIANIPCRCITNAPFYHLGSMTIRTLPLTISQNVRYEVNCKYYVEKWGGTPAAEIYMKPFNK